VTAAVVIAICCCVLVVGIGFIGVGLRGLDRDDTDDDTAEFFAWCSEHTFVEADPAPDLRSVPR
jgi:hypothetical protein